MLLSLDALSEKLFAKGRKSFGGIPLLAGGLAPKREPGTGHVKPDLVERIHCNDRNLVFKEEVLNETRSTAKQTAFARSR